MRVGRWLGFAGLLGLAAAGAVPPVTITLTGEVSHPGQNLVRNAGFDAHAGDRLIANWTWGTAVPENFDSGWSPIGRSAPGSAHFKTFTDKMSGYWSQPVPVTPGKTLVVRCWVRTAGGKNLLYLTGQAKPDQGQPYRFDERALLVSLRSFFLAPEWLKPEYLRGPELDAWTPLQKVITIPPGMTVLSFGIGSYFMAGESWVDDMYVGPPQMDADLTVRAADGVKLKRVVLKTELGGTVHDSGDLGEGRTEYTNHYTNLDAAHPVHAEVTTTDGKLTKGENYPPLAPAG